ncbi:hypothetical protein BD311DRAFT_813011 [Dichomitus squalens]|uniref:Proteophosphoglycan ppg4 n=1 Tax=Dichomitus squalens TaxID=114155 RepID=A0A4Q9N607_9APHY|nr:hypothetical protein BD311DRAFT_813011 [Dichomitus squalens]
MQRPQLLRAGLSTPQFQFGSLAGSQPPHFSLTPNFLAAPVTPRSPSTSTTRPSATPASAPSPGPSPLDKLAVELLTLIAFYACTDGGPTGCSLALVSKRVRAASRPARFFSVSLMTSPAQIEQFLACYQAERARATDALPRVRHLCLSLFGKGLDSPAAAPSSAASGYAEAGAGAGPRPTSRAEFLAQMQRRAQNWRSAQDSLDERYNHVVPTLVRAVAPDIQTLALVQAQWRASTVVRCCFPRLRELTLVGGDPSFMPFGFVPEGRPLYPALKRLHHILAFVGRDVDFLQWATHAPGVTHLRVSRLDSHPRVTLDTLDQVIGDQGSDEFFAHLQHVMIEPHPAPPPAPVTTTAHLAFRDFLAHLERSKERARVPVAVLPPLEMPKMVAGMDPHRTCIMRVKREWMERVEGEGAGCWEEHMHMQRRGRGVSL